jgi:hypothetical protein
MEREGGKLGSISPRVRLGPDRAAFCGLFRPQSGGYGSQHRYVILWVLEGQGVDPTQDRREVDRAQAVRSDIDCAFGL